MKTPAVVDVFVVIITFGLALGIATVAGLPAAGSWAVAAGLAAGAWRLHRAGLGLRDLFRPDAGRRAWRSPAEALLLAVLATLAVSLVVLPLGAALGWPAQDLSRFAGVRGDPAALAAYLALAWGSAALGEELLFRGVLMQRLLAALGSARGAVAVVLQALLFGLGHAYLGARGIASATVVGLVFGAAWLRNGRRLAPVILAHGLIDSASLAALFAGAPQ